LQNVITNAPCCVQDAL